MTHPVKAAYRLHDLRRQVENSDTFIGPFSPPRLRPPIRGYALPSVGILSRSVRPKPTFSNPAPRQTDVKTTPITLLDGPLGTELNRRGVETPEPMWSAAAIESHPELIAAI